MGKDKQKNKKSERRSEQCAHKKSSFAKKKKGKTKQKKMLNTDYLFGFILKIALGCFEYEKKPFFKSKITSLHFSLSIKKKFRTIRRDEKNHSKSKKAKAQSHRAILFISKLKCYSGIME